MTHLNGIKLDLLLLLKDNITVIIWGEMVRWENKEEGRRGGRGNL